MSVGHLTALLIDAARQAFTQARALHPEERFYCYALYTNDLASYICPTCSSEQGLQQVARQYLARDGGTLAGQLDELRWSPCDSPYHLLGEEHFAEVDRLLQTRPDPYELDEDAAGTEVHLRFEACFQALAQLDAEGFFGRGVDRDRVLVRA
jgi:Domain of unknown function (DUF4303)